MQRNKLRFVLCVPGIVVTLILCTAKPALTSEDVEKPSKHSGNYFWLSAEEQPALETVFCQLCTSVCSFFITSSLSVIRLYLPLWGLPGTCRVYLPTL